MKQKQIYRPKVLEIELSHTCNLRCSGCAILPDIIANKHILTIETITSFLKEAEQLGFTGYSLTGGEPMLHFDTILRLIEESTLELCKINTNGYIFATEKSTRRTYEALLRAGMGLNNKKHVTYINVSVGQQTAAGIPLINAVNACRFLSEYFPEDKVKFSINSFSQSHEYANYVIDQFLYIYEKTVGKPYSLDNRAAKVILLGSWYGLLEPSEPQHEQKNTSLPLKELVAYFDKDFDIINCSNTKHLPGVGASFPRILVRANGDVYSCTGFAYSHKLGNIHSDTLSSCIERANEKLVLRLAFSGKGLTGMLKKVEKIDPTIGNKIVSTALNPCNVCSMFHRMLSRKEV